MMFNIPSWESPQLEPSRTENSKCCGIPAPPCLWPPRSWSVLDWKMGAITFNFNFQRHRDRTGLQTCISRPPFLFPLILGSLSVGISFNFIEFIDTWVLNFKKHGRSIEDRSQVTSRSKESNHIKEIT